MKSHAGPAVALVALAGFSGCLNDLFEPDFSCEDARLGTPELHLFGGPLNANGEITHGEWSGPRHFGDWSAQILIWVHNPGLHPINVYRQVNASDPAYRAALGLVRNDALKPGEASLGFLNVSTERYGAEPASEITATLYPQPVTHEACPERSAYATARLAASSDSDWVKPGAGAWIHFTAFDANGSAYVSNVPRIDADAAIPKADLYEYRGSEPLKVFVYHDDPEEMPDRYREQGYVTVGPGLNDLVKRGNTAMSRSERVEPALVPKGVEWDQTSAGQRHPLYGKDVVFYVEVARVVEVCITPGPICDVPVESKASPSGSRPAATVKVAPTLANP